MLVNKTTERRDIPHEPDQWIEFRRVSGKERDEAQESQVNKSFKRVNSIGAETLNALQQGRPPQTASDNDPSIYDPDVLLHYAVVAWSYDEPLTQESLDLLDAQTRDWAVEQIVEMNTRPLATFDGSVANSENGASRQNSRAAIASTPQG